MPTRRLNGPRGGDYITDGSGNAVIWATDPVTNDNDLGGRLATAEATIASAQAGVVNVLDYATPAAAIAAATAGDTLYFPPGEYTGTLTVSKSLTVLANGAVFTGGGGIVVSAAGVTIRGARIEDAVTYGIHAYQSRTRIYDCTVIDSGSIGIFVETTVTTGANIADCEIIGCTVDRTGIAAGSIAEGGIKVHGYTSAPYEVIGTRIANNVVRMPTSPTDGTAICIEVWGGAPSSVIVGNATFGGYMGISVSTSSFSTVTGNSISGADEIGIELAASAYCAASGNTIDGDNLTTSGVAVSAGGGYSTISGNAVYDCAGKGLHIGSPAIVMTGNVVRIDAGNAIYLQTSAAIECVISGNFLDGQNTADQGVVLDHTDRCVIVGNYIDDFAVGGITVYSTGTPASIGSVIIDGNSFVSNADDLVLALSGGAALAATTHIQIPSEAATYTASNVSTDRAYDADATSTAELADVLGTLIADLRSAGILR
jgi:parallel beta-helix repeat protein